MSDNPSPEITHAQHVRSLALALFDRTRPLHGLNDDSRHTLEAAAQLIDQPFPPGKKKPHRAALALVEALPAQELTPEEKQVLAAVVAFHHRQVKQKKLDRFDLSPAQQRETLTIAALLRIAEGLDDSLSSATTIQHIEPTRDGMWIVVEGPQALSDAQVAQHRTRLWAKIGYPRVTIMEAAEAAEKMLPFPSPDEPVALSPVDPLAEAARKVMRYHFAQMLKHEPGTRLGEDIEALHDMRVATRRMRAAFEVFKDAFAPGALKPYLKGLRATGRALGAVRDMDVFIEKAGLYLQTLAAAPDAAETATPEDQVIPIPSTAEDLTPLTQSWAEQRQQARQKMLAYLDSPDYAIFKREFNTFLQTPGAGAQPLPAGTPVPHRVCELAPVLIYTRLASVLAFDPWLADAPIETLHALRIEFKKLRYTVEYFREVLGSQAKSVIEELKQLQDHLGDLNDAEVAANLLQAFIENAEAHHSLDPEHIQFVHHYRDYRAAECLRLIETFPKAWTHFERAQFRQNLARAVAALAPKT